MPHPAKRKGDTAELEAAAALADLTGWNVRRKLGAGRSDDTGDLDGVPDTTLQVKSYADPARAIREGLVDLEQQQANARSTFGAVLVRQRGYRNRPVRWVAVMPLENLAALLREATTPVGLCDVCHHDLSEEPS